MINVLILDANGSVARVALEQFLEQTDALASLIVRLATTPGLEARHSLGVSNS